MIKPRNIQCMTCDLLNLSGFVTTSSFPESWSVRLRRRFPVTNKAFVFSVFMYSLLPLVHLSISARSSDNVWVSDEMVFQFEREDKVESSA